MMRKRLAFQAKEKGIWFEAAKKSWNPMPRLIESEGMAALAAYLASGEAKGMICTEPSIKILERREII